jgi:putative Mn2+ efflux pump MntP
MVNLPSLYNIFELLAIAIALSMDAFAVTISAAIGFDLRHMRLLQAVKKHRLLFLLPIAFGIFQGLMPAIGYFLAGFARDFIHAFSGWFSLIILGGIGAKMIFDGIRDLKAGKQSDLASRLTIPLILLSALATSIDALVVGVDFLALGYSIAICAPAIAAITWISCMLAIWIGQRFNALVGDKAEIIGGAILIIIALRIFFFG